MNDTVNRNLQTVTDGSDVRSLTFRQLDAEIYEQFYIRNILWNDAQFIDLKPLEPGAQGATFNMFGDSDDDAAYHTPGAYIDGSTNVNDKATVDVDDILYHQRNLPDEDIDLSRWNLYAPHAAACARKVADTLDTQAFITGLLAARTAAVANVHPGGNRVTNTGTTIAGRYPVSTTGATNFIDDAAALALLMDLDNIPDEGRFLFIRPEIRNTLLKDDKYFSRDYVPSGNTMLDKRTIGMVAGFNLVMTQRLPSTVINTGVTKYQGNFTAATGGLPAALALVKADGKSAIGAVQTMPLRGYMFRGDDTMTWKLRAYCRRGFGVVCPWLAGEIAVTT